MSIWICYGIGYFFALFIGHWLISWVVNTLWSKSDWLNDKDVRPFAYTPSLVGLVERTLFLISLQLGFEEFIAVWLAMKVAGQWKNWETGADNDEMKIAGRVFFSNFLIGTGFSIAYAVVGFLLITDLSSEKYLEAAITPILLIIGTILFIQITKYYQTKFSKIINGTEKSKIKE